MGTRVDSVFFIVWDDPNTGNEVLDTRTYSTREDACKALKTKEHGAEAFHVAEFRRLADAPVAGETVTLTAPEGTVGAIGSSVAEDEEGSGSGSNT